MQRAKSASGLKVLTARVRGMFSRQHNDEEFSDEIREHLDLLTEENVRRGMPLLQARREARIQLGGASQLRETHRELNGLPSLATLLQDVRYAARMLRKSAGFTAVAVLTLALGMGANTAVFSAVNPILFEPLPYAHPERVTAIREMNRDGSLGQASFGMYRVLAERNHSFEALSLFAPWQPTLSVNGQPQRLDAQRVSWTYFRVLGVSPFLGRDFQPSDDVMHGPNVVILSYGLWQRQFGRDAAIIGRQIKLWETSGTGFSSSDMYTVIGVAPRNFDNVLAAKAELWEPLQIDISQGRAWGHWLGMIGRLRPGATTAQAAKELTALGERVLQEQHPPTYGQTIQYSIVSLQDDVTGGVKPALLAILGAVVLVLLIACVNVTNLLLARGAERRGEFALRAALGAARGRMARQLLTESLMLAIVGGAFGLAVAQLGVAALIALSPSDLPRSGAIRLDGNVFLFALGITTVIGLVIGVIPALHASRTDLNAALKEGGRQAAGGHQRTRRVLVVGEVALGVVLLVSAGLLLRSLERLFAVPPGFDPSHLLSMQVDEVGHDYDPDIVRYRFWSRALDAVRNVPGVAQAAFTNALPLSGDGELDRYGVEFERDHDPNSAEDSMRYAVTPGYFQTMGIPLRRGRYLDKNDRAGAPPVAVISQSFANRKLGGIDPIGQRIHVGNPDRWYAIVGVVGDVKQMSLALNQPDAVYTTIDQWQWIETTLSLLVRTGSDAAALAPEVRRAIGSVDKSLPIDRVETMDELVAASAAGRQFTLILFEAFGIVALALAAVGIYGVLSGGVAERTREIGIRLALGAPRARILRLVMGQGMALTGLGVVIGLGGALGASQAMASELFGISPLDAWTYAGVVVLLGATAVVACWIPARRAMRVDPMVTLRYE